MSLAVHSDELWICTVYYYMDSDFDFYIFTDPNTKHGKMFEKSNIVACAVFDSHQKVTDKKIGAQIKGSISQIRKVRTLKWALKMWNNTNKGIGKIINFKNMKKKLISGRVYKISPTKIQFFNQELYGEKELEIFKFS